MRVAGWMVATLVVLTATGAIALYATAWLSSAIAPGTTAREFVLALATLGWILLAGLASAWIGHVITRDFRVRLLPAVIIVAAMAVIVTFVTAIDARSRSGALDIDAIGVAIWVPALLVALSVAQFNVDSAPLTYRRIWHGATVAAALAALALCLMSILEGVPHGMSAVAVVGLAGVTAAWLLWASLSTLLRQGEGV